MVVRLPKMVIDITTIVLHPFSAFIHNANQTYFHIFMTDKFKDLQDMMIYLDLLFNFGTQLFFTVAPEREVRTIFECPGE